jgi:lysophospholipase L1-like esterase
MTFALIGILLAPLAGKGEQNAVTLVHFGDSTCITTYLPESTRVDVLLNERLRGYYSCLDLKSWNVAQGGDYIAQFLDSGRYKTDVLERIPHIDLALIRYGHNDQKNYDAGTFRHKLAELCDRLEADYPGITIILETNTWIDPQHFASAASAERLNEKLNPFWDQIRALADERGYPLIDIHARKIAETRRGNWDQRIRNQQIALERFGERILDNSRDVEMLDVPNWFTDSHPNANGVRIMVDEAYRRITQLWPENLPVSTDEN